MRCTQDTQYKRSISFRVASLHGQWYTYMDSCPLSLSLLFHPFAVADDRSSIGSAAGYPLFEFRQKILERTYTNINNRNKYAAKLLQALTCCGGL